MACSCGCNPCSCSPAPVTCCTPTTESVSYTFENANVTGIGFFDNETDLLVQFRGLVSDSLALILTLDAPNNVIRIDFDGDLLITDIPDATTTQRGMLETATDAEAVAKAATDKSLTPSNLASPNFASTTSFAGLVELATPAETITGTSTTLAVTPAGLAAAGALFGTTTWADAVTRAAATPSFNGQLGVQLDTDIPYVANGTGAGDFDVPVLIAGANTLPGNLTIANAGFNITISGTGATLINTTGNFAVLSTATFLGTSTQIGNGGGELLNLEGAVLQINGASVPANSVLITGASAGDVSSALINTFISSANTQTGYTAFANGAVLRTCDTTTVTLPQLAQIVGTLIEDLKALQLPAA